MRPFAQYEEEDDINLMQNPDMIRDATPAPAQVGIAAMPDQEKMEKIRAYLQKQAQAQSQEQAEIRKRNERTKLIDGIDNGLDRIITANSVARGGKARTPRWSEQEKEQPNVSRDTLLKSYLMEQQQLGATQLAKARPLPGLAKTPGQEAIAERYLNNQVTKMADDMNPGKSGPGNALGRWKKIEDAATQLDVIEKQWLANGKKMTPELVNEVALATARLINQGGQTSEHLVRSITPNTIAKGAAAVKQWVTNKLQDADANAFLEQYFDIARRDIHTAREEQKKIMAKSLKKYNYVKKNAPEQFDDIMRGALSYDELDDKGNYKATEFQGIKGPQIGDVKTLPDGTRIRFTGTPGAEWEEF